MRMTWYDANFLVIIKTENDILVIVRGVFVGVIDKWVVLSDWE